MELAIHLVYLLILAVLVVILVLLDLRIVHQTKLSKVIAELSSDVVLLQDLDALAAKVRQYLTNAGNIKRVSFVIYNEEKADYEALDPNQLGPNTTSFEKYKKFILHLESEDKIIQKEELLKSTNEKEDLILAAKKYFSDFACHACVPLIFERRLIGAINIDFYGNLPKDDKKLLDTIKPIISVAYTNALLFKRMQTMSVEGENSNDQPVDLEKVADVKSTGPIESADARTAASSVGKTNTSLKRESLIDNYDFVGVLSHEFLVPLASLEQYNQYILSGKFGVVTDKQKDVLKLNLEEVKRLRRLVDQMDSFANLDNLELTKEHFSVNHLIEDCIAEEKPFLENINLNLHALETITVVGDRDKIKQVILNLFSNAIKFTDFGDINISLETLSDEGKKIARINIQDTGLGIPKEILPTIFDRFNHHKYSIGSKYSGPGLGLAIVKSILEAHGSKYELESVVGKGTTFSFTLPIA